MSRGEKAARYLDALEAWRASEARRPDDVLHPAEWSEWHDRNRPISGELAEAAQELADELGISSTHPANLEPLALGLVFP